MKPILLLAVLGLVSCSDDSSSSQNNSTNTGAGATCPATAPEQADPCTTEDLECEFFPEDPRPQCHKYSQCRSGAWSVIDARCQPLPTVTCPTTRAEASGASCDVFDSWCVYDDGLACECTNCTRGPVAACEGDPVWRCDEPNTQAGCPAARPLRGAACPDNGKVCQYECGVGSARKCINGVWQTADGPSCPI